MNETPTDILTVAELQRLLIQTDPAVLLVPPRILRRIIKRDRALTGLGLQVPHRKSYVLDRERLTRFADTKELGLEANRDLPPTLLLLARPEQQHLAARERGATLRKYWRLLFHARIHRALHDRLGDGLRSRIQRIGQTEFDEARTVLRQESFLLPPGDAATVYEEFAAVYLELLYFAPGKLPLYFPACTRRQAIEAVLAEDVDADALFAATRLPGAADPAPPPTPSLEDEREVFTPVEAEQGNDKSAPTLWTEAAPRAYRRLLRRADKARERGNMVRASVFRMRAVALAPSGQRNPTRAAAQRDMEQFSNRLQHALGYSDRDAADWRHALLALLEPAACGIWPIESRLLYDLQKACIDRERPVYAVDFIEWLITFGRRPIKRLLPFHDSVRLVKHLRGALHRLTAVRIDETIRRRLLDLLLASAHDAEHRLRERLRPVLRAALDRVGLQPDNIAEETARDKVVEELIDGVVERGFFNISDVRDTLARNRLKLPDLTENDTEHGDKETGRHGDKEKKGCFSFSLSPCLRVSLSVLRGITTFFLGDELLRANRQLAVDLDGVYHRGEIYLRWLQRFSAAAFGTHIGRLLTLYIALPFGCSLGTIKVWDEVRDLFHGAPPEGSEAAIKAAKHINPYAFALLGMFFLALFHAAPFRRFLLRATVKTWHGLRWLSADLPAWLLQRPWVARVLQSEPWLFCYQFVLKPLPWAGLCTLLLHHYGYSLSASCGVGAAVFALASLLFNSSLGLAIEEIGADSLMRTWQLVHADLVPGLVRWLIYLYRRLQEEVERLIYTVDEWLRFRPGDSRLSLYLKPLLGLLWFAVTYVFRVIFNLFVEPTFNPIKHFPVVTVTAKLILPISKQLFDFFKTPLEPLLGKALGGTLAGGAIFLLPGLAGFLVWEFKENWRLYRANQATTLRPEIVGHHGETVLRLMRPGLHSGTLPKLYARLRHGRGRSPRKQYEALHHLGERLRQFVERNLFAVLAGSKSWNDAASLRAGDIRIATNRLRLELASSSSSVYVDFEEHGGWLLAGLMRPSEGQKTWLTDLAPEQTLAFRDALAGFYKLAGVDAVREQLESHLPAAASYDLTDKGLVVWPPDEQEGAVVYDLAEGSEMLFSTTPIFWTDWVRTWQVDHEGKGHTALLPSRVPLLPEAKG
jgi:hypothetical protein